MELVKSLPEDAESVEVTEVINAGTLWVVEGSNTQGGWSKARAKLDVLEMFLADAKCTSVQKRSAPQTNELVAVQLHAGTWHRGRVVSPGTRLCRVFLIDHGQTVLVPTSSVRDIDERLTKQEPLSLHVKLFGVLPARAPMGHDSCKKEQLVAEQWSIEANEFVQKHIDKSSIGYFCTKTVNESDNAVYGELYLVSEKGFLNLGILLCSHNYAVLDLQLFIARHGLNCKALSTSNSSQTEYSKSSVPVVHSKSDSADNCSSALPVQRSLATTSNCSSSSESSSSDKHKIRKNKNWKLESAATKRVSIGKLNINVEEERKTALKNVLTMCSSQLPGESVASKTKDASNDLVQCVPGRSGQKDRTGNSLLYESDKMKDQETNKSVYRHLNTGRKSYPMCKYNKNKNFVLKTELPNGGKINAPRISPGYHKSGALKRQCDDSLNWDSESTEGQEDCTTGHESKVGRTSWPILVSSLQNKESSNKSNHYVKKNSQVHTKKRVTFYDENNLSSSTDSQEGETDKLKKNLEASAKNVTPNSSFHASIRHNKGSNCRDELQNHVPEHLKKALSIHVKDSWESVPAQCMMQSSKTDNDSSIRNNLLSPQFTSRRKSSNSDIAPSIRDKYDSRDCSYEHMTKGNNLCNDDIRSSDTDSQNVTGDRRDRKKTIGKMSPNHSFQYDKKDTKYFQSHSGDLCYKTSECSSREYAFHSESNSPKDSEKQDLNTERIMEISLGRRSWPPQNFSPNRSSDMKKEYFSYVVNSSQNSEMEHPRREAVVLSNFEAHNEEERSLTVDTPKVLERKSSSSKNSYKHGCSVQRNLVGSDGQNTKTVSVDSSRIVRSDKTLVQDQSIVNSSNLLSSGSVPVKRNQKPPLVHTFFPAGFNMADADKVFADTISPQVTKQSSGSCNSKNDCSSSGANDKKNVRLSDSDLKYYGKACESSADVEQKISRSCIQNLETNPVLSQKMKNSVFDVDTNATCKLRRSDASSDSEQKVFNETVLNQLKVEFLSVSGNPREQNEILSSNDASEDEIVLQQNVRKQTVSRSDENKISCNKNLETNPVFSQEMQNRVFDVDTNATCKLRRSDASSDSEQKVFNETVLNQSKVEFASVSRNPCEQNEVLSSNDGNEDEIVLQQNVEKQTVNRSDENKISETPDTRDSPTCSSPTVKERLLSALQDYISESYSPELNVNTLPLTLLNQLIEKLPLLPCATELDSSNISPGVSVTNTCRTLGMTTGESNEMKMQRSHTEETCKLTVLPTNFVSTTLSVTSVDSLSCTVAENLVVIPDHCSPVVPSDSSPVILSDSPPDVQTDSPPIISAENLSVVSAICPPVILADRPPVVPTDSHSIISTDSNAVISVDSHTNLLVSSHVNPLVATHTVLSVDSHVNQLAGIHAGLPIDNHIVTPVDKHIVISDENLTVVQPDNHSFASGANLSITQDQNLSSTASETVCVITSEVLSGVSNEDPSLSSDNKYSISTNSIGTVPIGTKSVVMAANTEVIISEQVATTEDSIPLLTEILERVPHEVPDITLSENSGTILIDTISYEYLKSARIEKPVIVQTEYAANATIGITGPNDVKVVPLSVSGPGVLGDLQHAACRRNSAAERALQHAEGTVQDVVLPESDADVTLGEDKRVLISKDTTLSGNDHRSYLPNMSDVILRKDELTVGTAHDVTTLGNPEHWSAASVDLATTSARPNAVLGNELSSKLPSDKVESEPVVKISITAQATPQSEKKVKNVVAEQEEKKDQEDFRNLNATFSNKELNASMLITENKRKEMNKEVRDAPKSRTISVEPDPGLNLVPESGQKIIDQMQMMVVLLHGEPKGFRPLNCCTDVALRRDVHEVLKTMMNRLMRMQKYVWPLIQQGHNIVVVGPPTSGKTLGYAVPLVDQVLQKVQTDQVPKGNGPVVLILCSGSKSCNQIREIFWRFLQQSGKEVKVVEAYGGGAEKVEFKLVNGCHILISTPPCLKRLLELGKVVINFLRLKYLVLDEADVLTLRFLPEVNLICRSVQQSMKSQDKASLQVVAVAEKWCPGLEGLAQIVSNPVICIGAYLEALAYARLKPHLHFVTNSNKLPILCEIINKTNEYYTLVVCQEVEEVETVFKALQPNKQLMMAHHNMNTSDIHDVYMQWCWEKLRVLVCTDEILQEMHFQGATQLVHFSLPVSSKTRFAFRCSTLVEQLPDIFANKKEEENTPQLPVMHILISDIDSEPLPTLVHFLKRLGVTVDPDLQKRADVAEHKKEMRKDSVPLCYNTKAFGDCWNKSKCIFRHIISEKDKPQNIPMSGNVKVRILYAHDACNFSARILEHVDEKGKISTVPNLLMTLAKKIHAHFKNDANRLLLEKPKAQDICATEKPLGVYHRAEILAITRVDKNDNPTEALVRLIDDGVRDLVKVDRLFMLPESLKEVAPQSVELFLCRLIPCDLDWGWGPITNDKVAKIMSEAGGKGRFLVGKVKLSLGHTLWVDPLECYQSLPTLKTNTIIFSLRRKLLDEHLAVENPQHLQLLQQKCERAGLQVPSSPSEDSMSNIERSEEVKPCWAYLPVDEFSLVFFIVGDHPGRFYIRQMKFEDLVYKLDKKLDKIAKQKCTTDRTLFTGDYCIGRFPTDNRWYRARVERAQDDTLDLFFVDHGDRATVTRNEAIPLPKKLITQLPFQAIECCFAGLGPDQGDRWSEEAIDALYSVTFKPGTEDTVKLLYAKVLEKTKPADCTDGYKYHVALIDITAHGPVILNNTLVSLQLATQTDEQRQLLESLDLSQLAPPVDTTHNDSEEEALEEEQVQKTRPLSPQDIVMGEDWEVEITQNALQSEVIQNTMSHSTDDVDCQVTGDKSDIEEYVETKFGKFDFDNVTENEIMEFFEKLMENYNSQREELALADVPGISGEQKLAKVTCNDKTLHDVSPGKHLGCRQEFGDEIKNDTREMHRHEYDSDAGSCITSGNSDNGDQNSVSDEQHSMPYLIRSTRVPLVYWRQNSHFVWLKVELPGVRNYYLKWDIDKLEFWTVVDNKIYAFDLNLFGSINPDKLTHSGGLYIHIKMSKLTVGVDWLRLVADSGKLPWVKREYDAENDSDLDELHLAEQLRAVKEMEKRKECRLERGGLLPADEAPYEDDDDDDSDCSDVLTPDDEQYDPYDPMN